MRGKLTGIWRVVGVVLVVEAVVLAVSSLPGVRATRTFDPVLDGWVQGSGYVLAALLCRRPSQHRVPREVWLRASIAARCVGFVLYLGFVRQLTPQPYPSIADVCWLLSAFALPVASLGFVTTGRRSQDAQHLLDGAIVCLSALAVSAAYVYPILRQFDASVPISAIVTNLAYPLADLLLLLSVGFAISRHGWPPPRRLASFAVGATAFAVVDLIFLLQLANNSYRPGSVLPAVSLAATGLLAITLGMAATPLEILGALPRLSMPLIATASCLAILVFVDAHRPLPTIAATAAIALALVRTNQSFRTVREIARHREAAEAAEARFRGVLAATPDPLLGVREDGTVTFSNDSAQLLFDRPAHDLVGQRFDALVARPGEWERLCAANPGEPTTTGDLELFREDGPVTAEIRLSAPMPGGSEARLVALRDVSDRRALEAVRAREAAEAQRAQAARLESLGVLAGGIAHDFNNLLGIISNYCALISQRVDDPTALEDLRTIQGAVERGASLTNQMLTFARLDAVDVVPTDLNRVAARMTSIFERTFPPTIAFELVLDPEPVVVLADPHQMEQVLLNLALNARDAISGPGRILIETRRAGQHAELRVVDTGSGMPADVQARALEPFFTTKPPGAGTGLGLATVYGTVTSRGGTVEIESTEGHGTTICISLPLLSTPSSREVDGQRRSAGPARLLLIEDEPSLQAVNRRLLEANGYDVTCAADGDEAMALLEGGSPAFDLVVSDVRMPGVPIAEVRAAYREAAPALPFLFVTGDLEARFEPEDLVVHKPAGGDRLLRAVRQALDR